MRQKLFQILNKQTKQSNTRVLISDNDYRYHKPILSFRPD